MSNSDEIKALYRAGAWFVLCGEDKRPLEGEGGIFKNRPSLKKVLEHKSNLGIEPASLGFAVIDLDADTANKNNKLKNDILKYAGNDGFIGAFPSLSFSRTGRQHLWIKADILDDAPIGLRKNGKPYMIQKDLELNGETFDIRFRHGFVVCQQYFSDLIEGLSQAAKPNHKLKTIIKDHTKEVSREEKYYRKANEAYLKKITLPPEGEGHHKVANEVGFKVGQESEFNPWFEDMAREHLAKLGLKDERWQSFDAAIKEGEQEPEEPFYRARQEVVYLTQPTDKLRFLEIFKGKELRWDETLDSMENKTNKGWKGITREMVRNFWIDARDTYIVKYTNKKGEEEEKEFKMSLVDFESRIINLAMRDMFNPIDTFIDSIPEWDGKDRCWELFSKFKVEDNPLNRFASWWIWSGAYYYNSRVIYTPIRPIVILTGPQNIGKTAIIREMLPAGEMRDRLHGPGFNMRSTEKEKIEAVNGRILVEAGEMQNIIGKSLDSYKEFSQKTLDSNVRLAYRKNPSPLKRTAWIVGTSNKHDCLPLDDTEGQSNTRFLPVACNSGFNVEEFMKDGDNRMQIWAQVKYEVEKMLRGNGFMRMPNNLRKQQETKLDSHSHITSALEWTVSALTLEMDDVIKNLEHSSKPVPNGWTIHQLMKTSAYMKYKGELGQGYQNAWRLERELTPALERSKYWKRKNVRTEKGPRRMWVRTETIISDGDIINKIADDAF